MSNEIQQVEEGEGKGKEIDLRSKVAVGYDWGSRQPYFLSRREKVLVDVWLETQSILECEKGLKKLGDKWGISKGAIRRWLKREGVQWHIVNALKDKAIANGMTKDRWAAEGIERFEGRKGSSSLTFLFWKELGKAMGYYVGQMDNPLIQNNMQFNFKQADGSD